MKRTTGVIIARFQTPYLHEGHHRLIEHVKERHKKIVVVLGVAPVKGSKRNPFDFFTREKMLKTEYPTLVVLPQSDHPSDEKWSARLDELLHNTFPNERFVLYGGRDSFMPHYHGRCDTEEFPEVGGFNATEIREELSDEVRGSEDFRAGINYAFHNVYPKVFPTVDIAVFRDNRKSVLLGKKATLDQWRFIGGFVDPEDESLEQAALRELREECGDIEVTPPTYIGSFRVDDWRYRREDDKITTTLFAAEHQFGKAKADDDIVEVDWIETDKLEELVENNRVVVEHLPLFEALINHLKNTQ